MFFGATAYAADFKNIASSNDSYNVQLVPLDPPTISSEGVFPTAIAIDPSGRFVYIVNNSSNTLAAFSINTTSNANIGGLTKLMEPIKTKASPWSIAIAPTGGYLDISTNSGISQYKLDKTTGLLTLNKEFKIKDMSNGGNVGLTFNPNNNGLYVSIADKGGVHWFTTDKNGAIQKDSQTISARKGAFEMITDSLGKNLYVANYNYNKRSISMYHIAKSGKLSQSNPANVNTGFTTLGMAITPNQNYVYASNFFGDSMSTLSRNLTDGILSVQAVTTTSNSTPSLMAIDPTGRYLIVTSNGSSELGMYIIDQNTGALTNFTKVASGTNSAGIAIDPTGNFVYVLNNRDNTISMYRIKQNVQLVGPLQNQYVANGDRMVFTNNSGANLTIANITTTPGVQLIISPVGDTCTGQTIPNNSSCSFFVNVPKYYNIPTLINMIIKYAPGGNALFPIYVSYLPAM